MERSTLSTIGSFFTAALFASALLLSGCSDSLTGAQPAQETVEVSTQDGGGDTNPQAGHNTSDQD
jgi:predicted component of type VI protein secretion system